MEPTIKNNIINSLKENLAYVTEKHSHFDYPKLTDSQVKGIDTLLLQCYTRSKIISITYREKGRILSYTGMIERIDLMYKELYLLPKKKINFNNIVGINN